MAPLAAGLPVQSRKAARLLLALSLAVLCAAGCKKASEPAPVTAPVAAPQAEAPRVLPRNHIYSETSDPDQDIAAALKQAQAEHKRVLLDFGGDWCPDCQVLDIYLHQPPNDDLLARNYVVVHVFITHAMEDSKSIAPRYNVPIRKGVPALAVLDAHGKLLYSQTAGEFENMRNMESASVTDFLNRWKA